MIQPNCRARFTGDDFDFVVRTLANTPGNKVGLVELLTDIETRDQILDHDGLVRAVLEGPGNLTISPQFYFYILARLVLKRSGIDDRTLTDYVASLLEKFSQIRQMHAPVQNLETLYLSDLLLALKNASSYQTFLIRAHIGNYALFISGIFYESIESRRQRGAPSFSFYEEMGRASFHALATHDVARRYELSGLFEKLADRFHECRLALNCLTDEFVNIGDKIHADLRMNKTLFSEVQRLFERTYATVGINLEECLIDRVRCSQLTKLAGASARELSELARTFLRTSGDRLYVGIYYSNWLIEQLERHDPRGGLSNSNIRSLIMFVEEINHALHAALQFKAGLRRIDSEDFARNLELQGMVDTYLVLLLFVAFFRKTQRISRTDRRWLRFHLFESRAQDAFQDENLRARYLETGELASSYTYFLDTLNGARRLDEIRNFHALPYDAKRRHILALMNRPKPSE